MPTRTSTRTSTRTGRSRLVAVCCALLLTAGAGCSSERFDPAPATIPPATPADSPPTAAAPAGTVHQIGGHPQAAVFTAGQLVVLVDGATPQDPAELVLLDHAGATRTIPLPGPAAALADDGENIIYLATRGGYFTVDLATAQPARFAVDGADQVDFTAIAHRADGNLVLGSADGAVYTMSSPTAVANRIDPFARVDSIATHGDTAVVLDRGQTSLTALKGDGSRLHALRAGQGAGSLTIDPLGRVLVTDARGGQLLVFSVDPLIMRQAYPVPAAPYGVAGSSTLVWVSQTATNSVVGYDLSTGIPVEKVRYPTVQQPDSLAFDDTAGTLYVVSSSGAGIQVITDAGSPR